VAVRFLDDALAGELTEQFMLEGAHFGADAGTMDGEIAIPVRNNAGTPIAWFKWIPERPGAQILAETVPAMAAALVVAGIVIVMLLFRLKRSSVEIEAARSEAQHRALHDPLTGLGNRTLFQERLTQALERLGRGSDPVALLALDLDRFKQVNDSLGHEAGDELLQSVCKRIQRLLGDTDTLARVGGDEFVILQSAIKAVADSQALSQKIIAKVAEPYALGAGDARIGVSIGIAVAREPRDALDLVARADFALYQAKESGRNQARLYDEDAPRKTRSDDVAA
jgi:diguanylate cyclase (GGDEF)-like protein